MTESSTPPSSAIHPAVHMSWTDLLFLHWKLPADQITPHIPEGLELDTFDGDAWIALVPFRMTDCRFRGFSWVPTLRNFHECNVRTYARATLPSGEQIKGVWFFSLDAANLLPVLGGRWMWNLNYVYARFKVRDDNANHDYTLTRRRGPWLPASTHIRWATHDERPIAQTGSLEHFLTERYYLFTKKRNHIYAGRIHHDPWPLRDAELTHLDDSLIHAAGFPDITSSPPDSVLASTRIEVIGEPLTRLDKITPPQ